MTQTNVARVNGGGFYEINPAAAHTAIQAAIDSLGANGGVVDIYPGTATYEFGDAVISTKSNVRINAHGSILGFAGATSLYMFRVRGKNWTFDGGNFVDTPGASLGTNTRRIISIEDAGTNGASDTTRILNCKFDVTLATPTIRDYQCISVVGEVASSSGMRHGLFVSGCEFIAGVNSIPETKLVAASTTPYGITFIRTLRSGGQSIHDNLFRGVVAASTLANDEGPISDTGGSGGTNNQTCRSLGAHSAAAQSMVWDSDNAGNATLTGDLQPGSTFTVATDSTNTIYKITKFATAGTNQITVIFYPGLAESVADNDGITVTATTAYGHVASAITIEDGNQSNVHDNTLKLLNCQAANNGEGGSLIYMTRDTGEGGHSKIHDNTIEDVDAKYIVELLGQGALERLGWVHVNNNIFGRVIPRIEAAVRLDYCEVCKVLDNNFHNVQGGFHGTTDTHGYGIDFENCKTLTIAGNDWSLMQAGFSAKDAIHNSGGNENVHVLPTNILEYAYP